MTTKTAAAPPKLRTTDDIEGEIAVHEERKTAAALELGQLRARRPVMLLDLTPGSDDRLDDHDKRLRYVERVAARQDAAIGVLKDELTALHARETEGRRLAAYNHGVAAAAEYRRLVDKYATGADALAVLLKAMCDQAAIVNRANGFVPDGGRAITLPDGERPLPMHCYLPAAGARPDHWG